MNKAVMTVVCVVAGVACLVAAQYVGESAREMVDRAGYMLVGLGINPMKLLGGGGDGAAK